MRQVYDVRTASFLQLIRHVLGMQRLESWPTSVTRAFDRFIADHANWSALQIRFLQTLRTFVLQRRQVERRDLVESPFTQLHPSGIRGVFDSRQRDEVISFAESLVA